MHYLVMSRSSHVSPSAQVCVVMQDLGMQQHSWSSSTAGAEAELEQRTAGAAAQLEKQL